MKQVCSTSILTKVYVCSIVYTELIILAPDYCTFNLVIQICHGCITWYIFYAREYFTIIRRKKIYNPSKQTKLQRMTAFDLL